MYNSHHTNDSFKQLGKLAYTKMLHTQLGEEKGLTGQKLASYVDKHVLRCGQKIAEEREALAKEAQVYTAGMAQQSGDIATILSNNGMKEAAELVVKQAEEAMEQREALVNEDLNAVPEEHNEEVDNNVLSDMLAGAEEQALTEEELLIQALIEAGQENPEPQTIASEEDKQKVAAIAIKAYLKPAA